MSRKFVCAYFDWLETLQRCTDEEIGRLLRAALSYARDGVKPSFAEGTREDLYWWGIVAQLDRDGAKYDKRIKAGEKSGEVRRDKVKANQESSAKPSDAPAEIQAYIEKIKAWKDSLGK